MTFSTQIARQIWDKKYRFKSIDGTPIDETVEDTWKRIALALSRAEKADVQDSYYDKFYHALEDFKFLPAGRIIAGANTGRSVTLFNCFVMGTIPDNMSGIFQMLKEAALTMQQGGGVGYDFSTIRPAGAEVKGVGADASGPLTFMDCWDAMCRTVMSAGSRRGAMMGTMRCDHPDIKAFVEAKQDSAKLRMFNLSVLVTDAFMKAVKEDSDWELVHAAHPGAGKSLGERQNERGEILHVYKTVKARDLWRSIMKATYNFAEPGVIFIDRVNAENNLRHIETISSTNPCAEQPLPPYGACLLGSINLTKFVNDPFSDRPSVLWYELDKIISTAVRMLDNVIDVSAFPLAAQVDEAKSKRRIGLGVTGLADTLAMMGLTYGSPKALRFTADLMRWITNRAYLASTKLADEKGSFQLFNKDEYLDSAFIKRLANYVQLRIAKAGIRNSHIMSIAPTGTISLFAGNVSSGIEPIFAPSYTRKVIQPDGSTTEEKVEDYAVARWSEQHPNQPALPSYFVTAQDLAASEHLAMQAVVQKYVDSAISKTINLPSDIPFDEFAGVYERAYDLGCKGCTTYRPNDVTGSVLSVETPVSSDEGGACQLVIDPATGQLVKSCE